MLGKRLGGTPNTLQSVRFWVITRTLLVFTFDKLVFTPQVHQQIVEILLIGPLPLHGLVTDYMGL